MRVPRRHNAPVQPASARSLPIWRGHHVRASVAQRRRPDPAPAHHGAGELERAVMVVARGNADPHVELVPDVPRPRRCAIELVEVGLRDDMMSDREGDEAGLMSRRGRGVRVKGGCGQRVVVVSVMGAWRACDGGVEVCCGACVVLRVLETRGGGDAAYLGLVVLVLAPAHQPVQR
eukprot:1114969-Rhodomonas_salina.1